VTDRQTDGRRDGQNYDCQDRASMAASRGKNVKNVKNVTKIKLEAKDVYQT